MASWIAHAILADGLLARDSSLDPVGVAVGSVAPDCNVENADWSAFTPSREITHWMTGPDKRTADFQGFRRAHLEGRAFSSNRERSYLLGYYAHLVADVAFMHFLHDPARLHIAWARVRACPALWNLVPPGTPEDFPAMKRIFGKEQVFRPLRAWEFGYLREHPQSVYRRVLMEGADFPDVLGLLPPGAIGRKLGILAREPVPEAGEGFPFFLPREYEGFLARTEERVWTGICSL